MVCPVCLRHCSSDVCPYDGHRTVADSVYASGDPFSGSVISDRYRIIGFIGAGSMGMVYRAVHLETGGEVAVKILFGGGNECDPEAVRRFRCEAKNAACLRHPNTVRVFDFGRDTRTQMFFLVMEYLEGRSLEKVVEQDGRLPWRRATNIVIQVLSALQEAHEHPLRIIHRDLKPQNIFILNSPPDFVKVVDFGLSRSLGAQTHLAKVSFGGTPAYMSPEQWSGKRIDHRSDIYSLGCLFYTMLAGQPPFVLKGEQSPVVLALMHSEQPPPPLPGEVAAETPPKIVEVLYRMLAKNPEDRPQSVSQILGELAGVLKYEGIAPDRGDVCLPDNLVSPYAAEEPAHIAHDSEENLYCPRKAEKGDEGVALLPVPTTETTSKPVAICRRRTRVFAHLRVVFRARNVFLFVLGVVGGLVAFFFFFWNPSDKPSDIGMGIKRVLKTHMDLLGECDRSQVASSCTIVGWNYENGKQASRDRTMAKKYYRKGCELGHAGGCWKLAALLRRDDPNDPEIGRWLRLACALDRSYCEKNR